MRHTLLQNTVHLKWRMPTKDKCALVCRLHVLSVYPYKSDLNLEIFDLQEIIMESFVFAM
jgi:hypothetical protein